ncbi:hypothetical protein D8B26_006184 [Coccidioides posadasii str. Silveira]|uniref:uncharacterized protein n=1 Tax=Coccidioides posadasii (strain RMSCC 757 / Silveira) TaxID=443226 RepID=UPI001BEF3B03|nr:hypothetical protein D8B26_006184 [Coccidioides posadasii str. Silveira]
MLRFTSILAKLAEIIARDVKDLASFSLHIDIREVTAEFYSCEYADIDAAFSYHALVRLLDAIPPTCTNLERDTGGIEMYQDAPPFLELPSDIQPTKRGQNSTNFVMRLTDVLGHFTYLLPSVDLPNHSSSHRLNTWHFIRTSENTEIVAARGDAAEILENLWKCTTDGSRSPVTNDVRNVPTGACDTMRLDWEPDPPQVCLQEYIREQQALFGFRGPESYILADINPSKFASYRLHGLSESVSGFADPDSQNYSSLVPIGP